jgi:hypothetical protein
MSKPENRAYIEHRSIMCSIICGIEHLVEMLNYLRNSTAIDPKNSSRPKNGPITQDVLG